MKRILALAGLAVLILVQVTTMNTLVKGSPPDNEIFVKGSHCTSSLGRPMDRLMDVSWAIIHSLPEWLVCQGMVIMAMEYIWRWNKRVPTHQER